MYYWIQEADLEQNYLKEKFSKFNCSSWSDMLPTASWCSFCNNFQKKIDPVNEFLLLSGQYLHHGFWVKLLPVQFNFRAYNCLKFVLIKRVKTIINFIVVWICLKKKLNLILLLSGKNPVNFTSYNKVVPDILPGKRSMYLHSHIKISFRLIETKARQ